MLFYTCYCGVANETSHSFWVRQCGTLHRNHCIVALHFRMHSYLTSLPCTLPEDVSYDLDLRHTYQPSSVAKTTTSGDLLRIKSHWQLSVVTCYDSHIERGSCIKLNRTVGLMSLNDQSRYTILGINRTAAA
jgi:hypothetical protein